jgi:hypothetical protein
MTKEELWGYVKIIQKEYKKDYPGATLTAAFAQLQDIPVACLRSSLDTVMLQHTTLPPMQRIVDATKAEYAKRRREEAEEREHQAAKEKREFEQGQQKAFREDSGIAKQTVLLVRAMLAGKITRAQALEGIRHLDASYPSAGFATAGASLSNYYEKEGKALDRPCGLHQFGPEDQL